ncbi:DUF3868 domain-containing protein [Bacteroides graminisolvens]|uniref:DUF3868 domain-containing protein n=1 Tax=Bacteroides graminisolvens TaxID=477666 RepID=UPI0029C8795C|nr:DUF3868 domain-containing protein [Bacteroides graminisolvens]
MKKNAIALLLLLFFCGSAYCQSAYKGQLQVTDKALSVSSGKLQVNMGVSYQNLKLPSDESLTLTPVLQTSGQSLELPSILLNGPLKQKVYNRSQVLSKGKKTQGTNAPSVVIKDDHGSARHFSYKVQIPYKDWMKDAVLVLRTEECGCNGKPALTMEDKIADAMPLPASRTSEVSKEIDYQYLNLTNVVSLSQSPDTLNVSRGVISLYKEPNLSKLSADKLDHEIYFRLREAMNSLQKRNGVTVKELAITGYGAPDGNYRKNEKAGSLRALALKDHLRENYLAGNLPIRVSWVAEDWDSIRTLVAGSDMPLGHAVSDIINTVELTKGRERMLMQLADGTSYRYLCDRIFPQVRRLEYAISYTERNMETAEGRRLFEMGSRSLKLSEFFAVAQSYPKGSNEYNDAFDLAARLFPDSPEAAINAAAVALSKRDAVKARAYMGKHATLPIAYNNMGILYLLEGNRDKAEVYLQMAAAAGVPQAKEALELLRKKE